ncbi:MAG: GNAT family N-acetyltransferase [Pseudomonadota bacterium]
MRIRQHQADDFRQLADLRWLLKTGDGTIDPGVDRAAFLDDYLEDLRSSDQAGDTVHWVIEDRDRLIGSMTIRTVRKELSPGEAPGAWGYLTNSFVRPEMRGLGHGTELLARAISWSRARRLELLIVWPSERSYAFYRRAGFSGQSDPLQLSLTPMQDAEVPGAWDRK